MSLTQADLDAIGDDIEAQTIANELARPPTEAEIADLAGLLARIDIRLAREARP